MRYGNATKSACVERDELPDVYCPKCDNEHAKNNQVDNSYDDAFGVVTDWDTEEYCDDCGEPTWSSREAWDDEKDEYLEAERIRQEKKANRLHDRTMTYHEILTIMARIYTSAAECIPQYKDCKPLRESLTARIGVYKDVVDDLGLCNRSEFMKFVKEAK